MSLEGERYVFEAEWYDRVASLLKKFYLYYFPADNTVELFDLKTRKTFLKRTKCEGIEAKDFFIGGIVTIFSRNIKITDYADSATKNKLQTMTQKTLAMIKPDAVEKMGEILKSMAAHDFHIRNIKMVKLSESDVFEFYKGKEPNELPFLVKHMANSPIVVVELVGENAISRWNELIPTLLKVIYRKDSINNAAHGSENAKLAEKELNFFFSSPKSSKSGPKNTATFKGLKSCTCCVIKPHAVQAEVLANIIDDIQKSGFVISAMQQFVMDSAYAEEFLEVYKGVLPDYEAMVVQLQSGPCIAMEITHKNQELDVPVEFRKLCGPMDPVIAKRARPDTLRAKYGKSKVQNAVHCSDLPEDGLLEVEYFFKILENC